MSCPHCERKRQQQADFNKAWKEGKAYAESKGLDSFVLCLVLASLKEKRKRYTYCEIDDPRIGLELREITTIVLP